MSKIIIIASGPSISYRDIDAIIKSQIPVCVVNNAYKLIPHPKYVVAGDLLWWRRHYKNVEMACKTGKRWTCSKQAAREFNLNHTNNFGIQCINSGLLAILLMLKKGYDEIGLYGFDNSLDPKKPPHFDGSHLSIINISLYLSLININYTINTKSYSILFVNYIINNNTNINYFLNINYLFNINNSQYSISNTKLRFNIHDTHNINSLSLFSSQSRTPRSTNIKISLNINYSISKTTHSNSVTNYSSYYQSIHVSVLKIHSPLSLDPINNYLYINNFSYRDTFHLPYFSNLSLYHFHTHLNLIDSNHYTFLDNINNSLIDFNKCTFLDNTNNYLINSDLRDPSITLFNIYANQYNSINSNQLLRIVNCSRHSKLLIFRKKLLKDFLFYSF